MNPNTAFRDRNKRISKPITDILFTATHTVTFNCPNCNYSYFATFWTGMTLYCNNLRCPVCTNTDMEFTIDP